MVTIFGVLEQNIGQIPILGPGPASSSDSPASGEAVVEGVAVAPGQFTYFPPKT